MPPDDRFGSPPGPPDPNAEGQADVLRSMAADPLHHLDVLQQQLSAVREQLTESQRLATIGTISSVIAHEFNNILTPIVSYAQFALTSAESDKPDMPLIRKALAKSFQSATKAGKICASMLALARGESTSGPVPVQQLVDEALSVLARDPQKDGIALRVQVQPGLCVMCDPVQIEQVLLNLLINARHALMGHSRNGAITIKAAAIDEDELKIQVIDNGPGIPEKLQSKIFEPFFTTKGTAKRGEAKGSGLGLAICREIVAQHKGRIEVESSPGKGTTFNLWLPAAAPAADTEGSAAGSTRT
ncbi:sensor histidine kinase [Humisphaera borealis]|uniref:histidine kinase n=1 Tax=Humisphaera borealis TaxID=2807512 RepID=A0A7M2X2M7_9BACT|nr:ATP-binding protein [Humisphaera borealis]QOV92016.1 hypothetical protein IPV69_11950 [Humisphaera borealis]